MCDAQPTLEAMIGSNPYTTSATSVACKETPQGKTTDRSSVGKRSHYLEMTIYDVQERIHGCVGSRSELAILYNATDLRCFTAGTELTKKFIFHALAQQFSNSRHYFREDAG